MTPNHLTRRISGAGKVFSFLILLFILSVNCSAQFLAIRSAKTGKTTKNPDSTVIRLSQARVLSAADSIVPTLQKSKDSPTITKFYPAVAAIAGKVTIIGAHFDNTSKVYFGGTPAISQFVNSDTKIVAVVGSGSSGDIMVTNAKDSTKASGFIYALPPTVTAVTHGPSPEGTGITITGTNFVAPAHVSINGGNEYPGYVISPTTLYVPVSGSPILTNIEVTTPGGGTYYPSSPGLQANIDLSLPDFGNGLSVIPTPSFDYNQIYHGHAWSFAERVWGNSLGTDSSLQRVGAKLLSPQTSLFGVKGESDWRFSSTPTSKTTWTAAFEANFLVKKISYFDSSKGTLTNFNPFMIHPRVGLVASFFQDNVFLAAYGNFPAVVGSNDQFSAFFKTRSKNVFFYPEIDMGGMLSVSNNGNQVLKLELNFIINNGDAQFMSNSTDVIIPYLKFGFVTAF